MAHCRLCQSPGAQLAGSKLGTWSGRTFELYRCPTCRFIFVGDPWLDYERLYDEDYYAGRGADPLVDYAYEVDGYAQSIRLYEWRGIHERVGSLTGLGPDTAWLDYGCGAGGLVRYLIQAGHKKAIGFEQDWARTRILRLGVPALDRAELERAEHVFDVVTAVEVIEHVYDPITELRRMRKVLKPGGLLFLTTGNPSPYLERLEKWRYIVPEVHISFFEPETLAWAMRQAGFEPVFAGFGPGWVDILRFKILKNLGRHRVSPLESALPWSTIARIVDRRFALSAQPLGLAV